MNDFKTFDNQTLKESAVLMHNHFLSSDYHNPIVDLFQNKDYKSVLDEMIDEYKEHCWVLLMDKNYPHYQSSKEWMKNMVIPYIETENWIYSSFYYLIIVRILSKIWQSFPWLFSDLYPIFSILEWWITDYFYSLQEDWPDFSNDIDKNYKEILKNIVRIPWIERTIIDYLITKFHKDKSEKPKLKTKSLERLLQYYIISDKALKENDNLKTLENLLMIRETQRNNNLIYAIFWILCYGLELYLYFSPQTLEIWISDKQWLKIWGENTYIIINLSEIVNNTIALRYNPLKKCLDNNESIDSEKAKQMIMEALDSILALKVNNLSYSIEWFINDKNRFQEVNSQFKVWDIWYVKDNREKKKIRVSLDDDYKSYEKRSLRRLK